MNTLKYLGLSLILLILGFLIQDHFLEFSLAQITNGDAQIVSQNINNPFYAHILFALSIGVIPLLYLIITKIRKLNFINRGFISCGIIILCGISLWQVRIFQLSRRLKEISKIGVNNSIQPKLNFDDLNFELYLFVGFLVGTILSILIFENTTKTSK